MVPSWAPASSAPLARCNVPTFVLCGGARGRPSSSGDGTTLSAKAEDDTNSTTSRQAREKTSVGRHVEGLESAVIGGPHESHLINAAVVAERAGLSTSEPGGRAPASAMPRLAPGVQSKRRR